MAGGHLPRRLHIAPTSTMFPRDSCCAVLAWDSAVLLVFGGLTSRFVLPWRLEGQEMVFGCVASRDDVIGEGCGRRRLGSAVRLLIGQPYQVFSGMEGFGRQALINIYPRRRSYCQHMMKSIVFTFLATLAVKSVEAHATFQQLWVDGVDYISCPSLNLYVLHD